MREAVSLFACFYEKPRPVEETKIFPFYHVALGLQTALSPDTKGSGLDAQNVLILAIWAFVGIRIASSRFRWEPQTVRA